jgi:hypothetical protein
LRKFVVALLGVLCGLLLAAVLPIWPWQYADMVGPGPLNKALGMPSYSMTDWTFPVTVLALFVAGGEIAARRLHQVILRRQQKLRVLNCCCIACGYNLTGNASGVCPECGTPVPSKPEVIA